SMIISAFPSMIWANVSNGDIFSVRPSPISNDITLITPVDFFKIVLTTTELGTYSTSSTIIYGFDFSNAWSFMIIYNLGSYSNKKRRGILSCPFPHSEVIVEIEIKNKGLVD